MIPLSVLDLAPIVAGGSASESFRHSVDLAQHAERWGYRRVWLAEHHGMPGIASAATAVLIGHGVIFLIGVPWLAVVRGFSLGRAIEGGFVPFVPGLIVKSAIAVYLGRLAAPWASRRIW